MAATRFFLVTLPILLILKAATQAEALECYVCEDCEKVEAYNNTQKTCAAPAIETTTQVAESTPAQTTAQTTAETTSSSTTTSTTTTTTTTTTPKPPITEPTQKPPTTTPNNTTTNATTTDPTTVKTSTEPPKTRKRRDTNASPDTAAYCVVAEYKVDGKKKVTRGCSLGADIDNTARCNNTVGDSVYGKFDRCYICNNSLCNSATKTAIALVPLLVSVIISYL